MTQSPLALAAVLLAACSGCGDDGPTDAGVDGPPDPCAPLMTFTGEYLTWDSGTAGFMGIPGASFTHLTDISKNTMTAPNGRFEMCIPAADGLVEVTPVGASEVVGGTVVVKKAVLSQLPVQSYRSFTSTRAADFMFEPALGHVFVHVAGGSRTVMSSATAAVQKTFNGTAWVDGNGGTDIYLGNIAPGTTTLMVTGGDAVGAGSVPVTAGAFTYVTILAR